MFDFSYQYWKPLQGQRRHFEQEARLLQRERAVS